MNAANRRPLMGPLCLLASAGVVAIVLMSSGPTRRMLFNSAVLAGGATAIAWPVGTLLAVLIAKFDLPGRRLATAGLGLLLFLPLYVQLSGWDAALGKLGWWSVTYGSLADPWLAGMRAAIVIHGVAAIPWVALIVGLGLAQIDGRQEEAALLEASPLWVLLRITLPQCWPLLAAAGLWVVITTVAEMTVTNIYLIAPGSATYTEELYMRFALGADPSEATAAILPALAVLAILLVVTLLAAGDLARRRVLAKVTRPTTFAAGPARWPLTALLWTGVLILLALPIGSLIGKAGFVVVQSGDQRMRSWSAARAVEIVARAPSEFSQEFAGTALLSVCAATLALMLAIALAWPARRGGWRAIPAVLAAVLGFVTPGPLVGVTLIPLLNQASLPPLLALYDRTPLAPVLAQTIRALPLTILLVWHAFQTLNDDVLSAAALDGAGRWRTLRRIALPQRKLALVGAWLAALAIAAGDLAWSHLVMPAGMDTIQRRVFGLVHSGVEEQVAGICLVVAIAYALLAGLIFRFVWPRGA